MSLIQKIYGSLFVNNNITGGTLSLSSITKDNSLTQILVRDNFGSVGYRDVDSITSGITIQDTFVTGFTFNNSTYDLTIKQNEGQSDLVTNLASLATDVYVVSGIYNPSNGVVTYTNTSGGTFEVSGFTTGMTDSYTTDVYLSGTELRFDNNIQGVNFYNVDLLPLLSGKTDVITFNTYTANTKTILDGKIDSVNNLGGANELFKNKSGTTLNFRTLSGGSNTTVSTVGDLVKIDVSLPPSMNTYVTGGTYNDTTDIITLTRNDGVTIDITGVTDNFVIAGSYSDSTDTISLLRQDGSFVNITGVTDTFTTGATYDNGTALATFNRNDGNSYTLDLSTIDVNDTFVTGFTYNDSNRFTISRNDGVNLSASINTMTGLTVNGSVSATTYFGDGSNLIGISSDDNYVTGGTLNNGTLTLERQNGIVTITGFTTDLDTYVTGGTVSVSATDSDNSGKIGLFYKNSDGIPRTLPFEDTFTTGGSYNNSTALITFDKNDGTTYDIDLSTIDVNDTFVTGFTYNEANTLTIERNDGINLSASINTMTGLTVNGTLVVDVISATTFTGLTLNDLDDVTTNIPVTPDNTYQGELLYFDAVSNQWVSGSEYGNLGEVTIWGKKGSAGTIDKGCPVYIVGFDDDIHEVELANATTATTMPVIGFTAEDFDNSGVYPIVTFGKITGLDTSSATTVVNPFGETWEVNDVLYMAKTDGGLTKFRPSGTNTEIQRIAKVLKVSSNSGQLFIFNTARTAGLPNLTSDYLWVGNGLDRPLEIIRTDVGVTTTGFTYNDNNTFTITDDNGGSLSSTINQMSGLTVNGDLDVTGDTTLGPLTATSVTSNSAINVFNGHINIRDNSYFLQGRTVADVNVSLIGVDNQDRVFVGNSGYDTYIDSDTIVDGVLSAQTTFLTTTPTLNNSATDILVRNGSTGEVEYRPVSGITPDTDTFVSGGTYNDTTNNINFSGNSTETTFDVDLTSLVSSVSANTFVISGTYVDSTDTLALLRNDGNFVNITGITDTFTTGATYDNGTALATFNRNDGNSYTLDLSTIDVNDTFVTGTTFSSNQATVTRNDGTDVLLLTGGTNVTLSNPSTNQIKIGLDLGIKSGTVRGTEFSGNPKTYKVIFTNAYSNDEYSINITGEDSRNYTYQNKTSSSFVINTNANTSFTSQVDWVTIKYGEQ